MAYSRRLRLLNGNVGETLTLFARKIQVLHNLKAIGNDKEE